MSDQQELQEVFVRLERLQGVMETSFASVQGQLAVLVERTNRTDDDVKALEVRLTSAEKRIYGLSGAAALVGIAAPYLAQALHK